FYKVKRGDSLFKIALAYKIDVEDLRKYNNLRNDNIRVGEELFIYNPSEESLKRLTRSGSVNRTTVQKNFTMPVKWAGVTSPFGKRFHPVLKRYIQHAGVDMRARYVPLMASKDGTVVFAGYMTGYGKIIKINHGNGFETRSAHLDKMYVKTGDRVKAGQVIGKTGMSGRVTGPHLHFEIRKNGKANNPMNYLVR
ncbi:MAG: peptidoglycan DD-metalloendopeptidase family protein, partial [Cetobacterium sp.]